MGETCGTVELRKEVKMTFEKILEEVGEKIDKLGNQIAIKVKETTSKAGQEVKKKKSILKEVNKKMGTMDRKKLSDFQNTIGNLVTGIAGSIEEMYKDFAKKNLATGNELKTKYGYLGDAFGRIFILKDRAEECKKYIKHIEKKIPNKIKVKKDILRDATESLSTNVDELNAYQLFGHTLLKKKVIPKNLEEKKKAIKKYLGD